MHTTALNDTMYMLRELFIQSSYIAVSLYCDAAFVL
nr:MAG TPA: hypothetical protein [Caudoviricetes sp.]DAZ74123.1 MAG TPA: hypothetical protein [Caudoviricetes sp.]